jgi:hypothetical protein
MMRGYIGIHAVLARSVHAGPAWRDTPYRRAFSFFDLV